MNARIPGGQVARYCELHSSASRAMQEVNEKVFTLTTRGYDQLLKVSRTVADLNNSALIYKKHVVEAAGLSDHEDVKQFLEAQPDIEQCPKCGLNTAVGDRFCRRCGCQLTEEKE